MLDNLLEALRRLPPVVSGGIGGLVTSSLGVYLLDWWRKRPRFRARVVDEMWGNYFPGIAIEVENLGDETSINPDITMTDYTMKGQRRSFLLRIEGPRKLPRYQPVLLQAFVLGPGIGTYRQEVTQATRDALQFAWFRTYTLYPTRGRRVRIHLRSGFRVQLSRLRFAYELLRFRVFGKVTEEHPGPMQVGP